jgi:hypothetical protein
VQLVRDVYDSYVKINNIIAENYDYVAKSLKYNRKTSHKFIGDEMSKEVPIKPRLKLLYMDMAYV